MQKLKSATVQICKSARVNKAEAPKRRNTRLPKRRKCAIAILPKRKSAKGHQGRYAKGAFLHFFAKAKTFRKAQEHKLKSAKVPKRKIAGFLSERLENRLVLEPLRRHELPKVVHEAKE